MKTVVIFDKPERFAGWPANRGIWQKGKNILVGFDRNNWRLRGPKDHHCADREADVWQAVSLDDGETWADSESVISTKASHGTLAFGKKDFLFRSWMHDKDKGASQYAFSEDFGDEWCGPFTMPTFGRVGVMARTSYLVSGKGALVFLTACKNDIAKEGRVFVAQTDGINWKFIAWIGEENKEGFEIMPSACKISKKHLLCATRFFMGIEPKTGSSLGNGINLYESLNGGKQWNLKSVPTTFVGRSNPPHLIRLVSGDICLTYGWRRSARVEKSGIRAQISKDNGATWGEPIILRADFEDWDSGYVRTVQRTDGKILTVYYVNYNSRQRSTIEGTIWEP